MGERESGGGMKEGRNIILNKQKKVTDITHFFFQPVLVIQIDSPFNMK